MNMGENIKHLCDKLRDMDRRLKVLKKEIGYKDNNQSTCNMESVRENKDINALPEILKKKGDHDLNKLIDDADIRAFMRMDWVNRQSKQPWGRQCAIPNEYIQRSLLNAMLPLGYKAFTTDDEGCPDINTKNNSPGFDIVVQFPDGSLKRIQSKLRQVEGQTPFSKQVDFETTRRNSPKNQGRNQTGHICYSCDEFDYVFVSLVHVGKEKDTSHRHDVNSWSFSLVPVKGLRDPENDGCMSKIAAKLLEKYKVID